MAIENEEFKDKQLYQYDEESRKMIPLEPS